MVLIERDRELSRISRLLAMAGDGQGATMLVVGSAGIGKTALLAAAQAAAADRGVRTLTALCGEFEQGLPFGVVRQLFEPSLRSAAERADLLAGAAALAAPVFGLDGHIVATEDAAMLSGIVYGLYWLCSNLAERGPLLLAVDDVHWADEPSLRFVSHLARRIADLPIVLMLCGRPQASGSGLDRALSGVQPCRIDLRPLSEDGVRQLVLDTMPGDADDTFCRACAKATGGNPFLLAEALASLRADGVRPVAAEAVRVENLRPETISRAVLTRLAGLGPDALRLARALAVLGPAGGLGRPARLAGLELDRAAEVGQALVHEAVITGTPPVQFVHPLVRTAIYADMGNLLRSTEHKRAARMLHADGVPADELVPHLLATEPESDPEVIDWLRSAATAALTRGAPEVAATCLSRALAEPAAAADRLTILTDLGRSLGMANRPAEAAEVLRAAAELAEDPELRAELAVHLGTFMVQTGRAAEAIQSFRRARDAVGDNEQLLHDPRAAFVLATFVAKESPTAWIDRLDRVVQDGSEDRLLLATLAFGAAATGDRPAGETARLAAAAAEGPLPADHLRWVLVNFAGAALAMADRFAAALDLLDRGLAIARRDGNAAEFRHLSLLRSHTALEAGRLFEAEADGRAALDLHHGEAAQEIPLAAAVLIDALVERGALDEAQAVLDERGLDKGHYSVNMVIDHFVLLARATLRLHQGRPRDALTDLSNCGAALISAGYTNPAFARWRAETVSSHLALGEITTAREVAAENLKLARRFQAPRALGVALRVAGLAEGGADGLERLVESVSVLRDSGADLERARSLIDYGAALRRAGRRTHAREPLRLGLDLAARCGAGSLTHRANEELVASGARPRRQLLTGPEALTASERRVARLAAGGATNREIAQMLFVSRRTVEVHLTSAYRKLQIDSRHQLKAALLRLES